MPATRHRPTPSPPDADVVLEIRVDDPVSAERGWAYLAHFAGDAPAPSPISYARYDTATDVARGRLYAIQYHPGLNFFTGMRFISTDGIESDDVLHRMKVRLNLTFTWA